MRVTETFFSLSVRDMRRATNFYTSALGATVSAALPFWTSIHIAGVRVGLFLNPAHVDTHVGLHFAVDDLEAVHAAIERAGGRVVKRAVEVAPGVIVSDVVDTEGNTFALRA
jgi:predicted enzyme related to lactoylglutathione lyase